MIYDISMPINENIQVYKNVKENGPKIITVADHEHGNSHASEITLNLHTGTHVDYPLHMIKNGKTSDYEMLDKLITKAKVFDVTDLEDNIDLETVKKLDVVEGDFVLFKTKNSFSEEFLFDFVYLNEEAANYLANKNIKGVGTDGLGIERAQKEHPTHKAILGKDMVIIEGLRLRDVSAGTYQMICLPLKITGVEANPARVILMD